ncbi:MAG TPA: type I-C CRISPR-associated protein Cas8c/Csd1, partial [Tepidisphaeraceae bacterium]
MILQRLAEYYDRLALDVADPMTPFGFSREKISFELLIDLDGTNAELADIRVQEGRNSFPRVMTVPDRGGRSGSSLKPNFLWDNTGYVFGRDGKGKVARSTQTFEAFRDFHVRMAEVIDDEGIVAVSRFLQAWSPDRAEQFALWPEAIDKNVVFRLRGRPQFVHQSPHVIKHWQAPVAKDEQTREGQSLISGDIGPIARLHPMISGVAKAQTMGAAIASFNDSAYESYGLDQTYNAPVTVADAFKYTTALNRLLENRTRRMMLGDATVVFWTERPLPIEGFVSDLYGDAPPPKADAPAEDKRRADEVRRFLTEVREGYAHGEILRDADDATRFYFLGLSPNASRLSVRFWSDSSVGEMKHRLAAHLADIELIGARDDDLPPMIRRIVQCTGRADFKNGTFKGYDADSISPLLAGAVTRAVLTGGPYPQTLLGALLNRLRADGYMAHVRFAAIKACLNRNSRQARFPLEVPVALDQNRIDTAYVTGRLFAVLENIQLDSVESDLNTTIKDRYFSSASATPGFVFPRLIRLSQHHMAKLPTTLEEAKR